MANPKEEKLPELLTINQVAQMLKVHPETLRRWDNEGRLKAVRLGNRRGVGDRRYHQEDVVRIIKEGSSDKKTVDYL